MKLTESQIIALKGIISKKATQSVDVQMEIIDHVASLVEDRMSADPNLSFEDAIKQANASFGIFGFGALADSILTGINRKYRKVFWNQFLSFFKLKYIGLVLFLAVLCYNLQLLIGDMHKITIGILLIYFIALILLFLVNLRVKRTKGFMNQMASMSYLRDITLFWISLYILLDEDILTPIYGTNLNYALISTVLVLFFIYIIAALKTALQGIRKSEDLAAKYGQLN